MAQSAANSLFMSAGRLVHLVLVICFWGLVITLYVWWQMRLRREAKQRVIVRKAMASRLLRPDWEFYEQHLQRPAPTALRTLFANRDWVTTCGLNYEKKGGISSFYPLDKDNLLDTTGIIGCDVVPFARSDCGDPIYLRPGAMEPDKVYIAYHDDPGNIEIYAESVDLLLERLKTGNPT